ncbi:unnamed protein product [Ranitomeya imitator]|uniref:Uncharacterized protein n=1 Tax=Ranitomeya imitator TaxID=111125 RepID=A0ABN9M9L9_9NEOB|nr:unnamed protein product [Ranitomeya imitator]
MAPLKLLKNYREKNTLSKKLIKAAKKETEKHIAKESKTNPKLFFNYINSKRIKTENVGPLKNSEERMVVDDEEKANILNTFFSTVFTVENEMLATGSVPQDWRIANVVPIFKKGSKSEPGNYRPAPSPHITTRGSVLTHYHTRLCPHTLPHDAPSPHITTRGSVPTHYHTRLRQHTLPHEAPSPHITTRGSIPTHYHTRLRQHTLPHEAPTPHITTRGCTPDVTSGGLSTAFQNAVDKALMLICSLSSYSVMAFVDSGAALNLMDLEFARRCGFFLEPLQYPIPLRGIDATPLAKNKPQY